MNDPSLHKIYYKNNQSQYLELYDINNLSISKNISYAEQYILGGACSATQINSPQQLEISFDRSFVNYDNLFSYTGDFPVSELYIYNGEKYYYASNLYLNTYSVGFSIGELPRISNKFTSYGREIQETQSISSSITAPQFEYDIPKLNSIFISGSDDSKINQDYNIFSFDYSIEINRQPYYGIGSLSANQVNLILPLKINASINSKLKNENAYLYENSISKIKQNNFNFDIYVSGQNSTISFPIKNAQLTSSEIVMSSNNTLEIKKQFLGYYGL